MQHQIAENQLLQIIATCVVESIVEMFENLKISDSIQ